MRFSKPSPSQAIALRRPAAAACWLLAMALGCSTALAAPLDLPPILDPASREHHPGKVIFEQLVTPDLAQTEHFYAGLFGWTFSAVPGLALPYATAYAEGRPVAGVFQRAPQGQRHAAWLPFFSVPDADATTRNALAHGAKVLIQPHTMADRGREAVLADPQGAVFAVLASGSGDPPDELKPPGAWIWHSLLTTDPASDAVFYQTLFGFETLPLPSPAGQTHLLLASEHYARATANTLPTNRPGAHPHWLNFVRVDDAAKSAALAERLGGHVLVAPRPDRHGGRIAVIADPLGAPVGLFEWAETETKQVTR
jgi:predicted enzyme related to lactoylglutathione lyase